MKINQELTDEHIKLIKARPVLTEEKVKRTGAFVKQGLINLAKVFRDVGDP